jgi:hypothetical protein
MANPKNICGFCVLFCIFVVKQASSSSNGRENWQFALIPSIWSFGNAGQTTSLLYRHAPIFIINNSSEEAEQTYGL